MAAVMSLADKAQWFDCFVQERLVDPHGAVYSKINVETGRPFVDGDLPEGSECIPVKGFSTPDILNYEDAGIASGSYLAALTYRYLATGDPEALRQAGRTFEGIAWIYDLGREREEGYFPKPYGGRCSSETSSDQYLYTMKSMMAYRQIAPAEHRERIIRMIPKMADFWITRDYKLSYFGIENMQWPIGRFACFAVMAHAVGGERKYLDEFTRLNEDLGVYKKPWESQVYNRRTEDPELFCEYEKSRGRKYLIAFTPFCAAMDIMGLDECLRHSDAHPDDWKRVMKIMWEEGKLLLAENGYAYMKALYDLDTGQVTVPTEAGFTIKPEKLELAWSFVGWIGKIYMPSSAHLARVAVNVHRWLGLAEAKTVLLKVLEGIQTDRVTDYLPADDTQMLTKHLFLTRQVCSVSIASWLWAYWQGRAEGLVKPDN